MSSTGGKGSFVMSCYISLTFSLIWTLSDASAADGFLKQEGHDGPGSLT